MKQFLGTACLTIVALIGLVQTTEANGGGLFRRSRGSCDAPCAEPCATTTAVAPAPIQYEDRKVKVYKNVWKEKEVEVLEHRRVTNEEKYTYTVSVPVWTDAKRMVTVSTPVSKVVDYTYTVLVPKTMQKTVQCTTYQSVTDVVKEMVPVCRVVCVNVVDECGRCHTRRETVTEMREVSRCVVRRVPVVTDRVVNYTVCEPVQHKGQKTVCEIVRTQREETYKVCSFNQEQRQGTRMVCSTVAEKVKRKVSYCERVESEEIVRVAINVPCASDCHDDCDQGGRRHGGRARGGLFRRGSGGCCN